MSLSKIYPTEDAFTPEDIIQTRLTQAHTGQDSFVSSASPEKHFEQQDIQVQAPAIPPESEQDHPVSQQKELAEEAPPERRTQETEAVQEKQPPAQPAQPTPPPPPPGIPQAEVDRLVTEAYERGLADGKRQMEEDFGTASTSLLASCQQLDTLRETVIQNSVGEIHELVIAIAEKIIRQSVQQQNETVILTVEEAIDKAIRSGEYTIYVHPDDFQQIASKAPEWVAAVNGLTNISVKQDPKIERGGCLVESDNCTVDATISGQLEVIRREMEKM